MDRDAYSSYCGGGSFSAGRIAIGSDTGNDLVAVGSGVGLASGAVGGAVANSAGDAVDNDVGNAVGTSAGDAVVSAGAVFGTVGASTTESVAGPAAATDAIGTVDSLLFSIVGSPSVPR